MSKISTGISNNFCPQTLFLYGTYKEDGTPDFGLFCWFSYTSAKSLGVMACIGGSKLTKDRINANGVFSANLVTEEMLPLADYLGTKNGYSEDKMKIDVEITKGEVLEVPVLAVSPWVFELEVQQSIEIEQGDVYLCTVKNVLAEEKLLDTDKSVEEKLRDIAPASTTCSSYFAWDGKFLGKWGGMAKDFKGIRK